jgi:hypothetical protein
MGTVVKLCNRSLDIPLTLHKEHNSQARQMNKKKCLNVTLSQLWPTVLEYEMLQPATLLLPYHYVLPST